MALGKTEVFELLDDGLGKLGNQFGAGGGEFAAFAPEVGVDFLQSGVEAGEFGIAFLELAEFFAGGFTEGDDFGERPAVFALERMDKVEAGLQFLEAGGVEVQFVGAARRRRLADHGGWR